MSAPRQQANAARRTAAGNGQLHQRPHGLLARGGRRRAGGARRRQRWPTCRVMRSAATTTNSCARRLQKLCDRIGDEVGPFGYRAFTDSAPVLEKALARNAGLGWIGKHTNLIDRNAGSYFFLGEIYLDLALPSGRVRARRIAAPAAPACRPAPPVRSSRPTASMRAAAFPISPSSSRAPSRSSFAAPSATASTDAMTASWFVPGTSLRARPRKRTSACATVWIARSSSHYFPGAKRNSWKRLAAAPSGASASNAGCAMSPLRSATRRARPA